MSLTLPLSQWPQTDRNMWIDLQVQGGPLDERGALAHLRQTSLQALMLSYGRWLTWLTKRHPMHLRLAPAERADIKTLTSWIEDLAHAKPMAQFIIIDRTLRILRAVAPLTDWSEQLRLVAKLRRNAGRGDKKRKFGRVLSSAVLLETGIKYATQKPKSESMLDQMRRRRD